MYRNAWPLVRTLAPHLGGNCLLKFVAGVIRPGDVILDVGANAGDYSRMLAAAVGPKGSVYAVEPNPAFDLDLLSASLEYGNIHPVHLAVSDRSSTQELFVDERHHGYASTLSGEQAARSGLAKTITVNTTTIDALCRNLDIKPAFMKLDIEGAEGPAIRGATRVLRECRPLLWFECWSDAGLEHLDLLRAIGYRLYLGTVIKRGSAWISRRDPRNPRVLRALQDDDLTPGGAIDVAAIHRHSPCALALA